MTTCPNSENWLHVSRTIRPVTQVALVAVNIASMTPSRPVLLEMGRVSSSVPTAMTSRKLMQMVCVALLPASQPLLGRRSVHSFFLVFPIATSRAASGHPPEGRVVLRLRAKFPSAEASSYRIHLFSLRFNLILCSICGIIFVVRLSSSVG